MCSDPLPPLESALKGKERSVLTHLALGSQITCFNSSWVRRKEFLLVVACTPSSVPFFPPDNLDLPRRTEPVHTVKMPSRFLTLAGEEKKLFR